MNAAADFPSVAQPKGISMNINDVPSTVRFYDHRGKHLALLAPGTPARRLAEKVVVLRGKEKTFAEIAEQLGLSLSTAHRLMNRLAMTMEVESGKRDREIRRLAREAAKETGKVLPFAKAS